MRREVRRIDMEISLFAYPFDLDSPPVGDPKLCEWHDFSLSLYPNDDDASVPKMIGYN
jgi:hypothetical protein